MTGILAGTYAHAVTSPWTGSPTTWPLPVDSGYVSTIEAISFRSQQLASPPLTHLKVGRPISRLLLYKHAYTIRSGIIE